MINKIIIFILFVTLSCTTVSAQLSIGEIKKEASNYVKHKQYFKALKLYERIRQIKPSEKLNLFKIGLCYYQTNQLDQARKNFVLLLNQEGKPEPLSYLYLGNIYHQELDFDQAISFYKLFLKKTGAKHKMSMYAVGQIKRCAEGRRLAYSEQLAYAENMGSTLNSIYDEIIPMPSPNYNDKIYFSSVREGNIGGPKNEVGDYDPQFGSYWSDIFTADLNQGVWSNPRPINPHLNTAKQEYLLDFGERGRLIYFLQSDLNNHRIYVDTFVQQLDSNYVSHTGIWSVDFGIDSKGAIHFYNDTTLVFSSRTLGGYGGYDLYISKFRNGIWAAPINLGPEVNTGYDEVSPFLTMNGRELYFSSNRLTSIGGFDIFKINYDDRNNRWARIKNLKSPINSAADDLYFRLDKDGSRGWFSSGRSEGFGGLDLYSCFFKQKVQAHLVTSSPVTFDLVGKSKDVAASTAESGQNPASTPTIFSSEEIRDFSISPLYYDENDFILSPANVKIIDKYISLLKSYPGLAIQLTAHADGRDPEEFDHYFSVKRAEKLADHMISKGVPSSRIIIRGCGSAYPVAQNSKDGVPYRAGQTFNRRIEIQILNVENMPVNIEYIDPVISERIGLPQGSNFKKMNKGLSYRVKIAGTSQPFTQYSFTKAEHPMVEKYMNISSYDFIVGIYKSYISAKNKKADALGSGLTNVEIIPYIDGARATRSRLQIESDKHPDLIYYLEEN